MMTSLNLKGSTGVRSFTDEQAALLGYVKAPDQWVTVVYKFPLKMRLRSLLYRAWVRLRYGIRTAPMWWAHDEPGDLVEMTQDDSALDDVSALPSEITPDMNTLRQGEDSLKRYMTLAERWQGPAGEKG